jgi:hypothetical protein
VVLIFNFCNFIQHWLPADVFQIPPQTPMRNVGCNGNMTLQEFISRLNWRQILVHFAALLFLSCGFYTLAFLYDIKIVDTIGESILQDGGAWWGDIGIGKTRLTNFSILITISAFVGIIVSFLISLTISIRRHWFWLNSLLVFILAIIFLFWFDSLGSIFVRKVFWYPGRLLGNTTIRFLANGIILLTIGLLLFYSGRTKHFIEGKKLARV